MIEIQSLAGDVAVWPERTRARTGYRPKGVSKLLRRPRQGGRDKG